MQLVINSAMKWAKKHGFTFSLDKTMGIHFTKKRGMFPLLTLKLQQELIKVISEVKFLALVFDAKLSWIPHLKMLRSHCLQSMNLLKCLSCTSWGAERATLLRVYRALIRSRLDYGLNEDGRGNARLCSSPSHSVEHGGISIVSGR